MREREKKKKDREKTVNQISVSVYFKRKGYN